LIVRLVCDKSPRTIDIKFTFHVGFPSDVLRKLIKKKDTIDAAVNTINAAEIAEIVPTPPISLKRTRLFQGAAYVPESLEKKCQALCSNIKASCSEYFEGIDSNLNDSVIIGALNKAIKSVQGFKSTDIDTANSEMINNLGDFVRETKWYGKRTKDQIQLYGNLAIALLSNRRGIQAKIHRAVELKMRSINKGYERRKNFDALFLKLDDDNAAKELLEANNESGGESSDSDNDSDGDNDSDDVSAINQVLHQFK
jgi:hypothetical protein